MSSDETLGETLAISTSRDSTDKLNYSLYNDYETDYSLDSYYLTPQESTETSVDYEEQVEQQQQQQGECEEDEDDTEFDPYQFIAQLPHITTLEKRNVALPSRSQNYGSKFTLVLDLDETLVHCSTDSLDNAELQFPVVYSGREYQVSFFVENSRKFL